MTCSDARRALLCACLLTAGCADEAPPPSEPPAPADFAFLGPRGVGYPHAFAFDPSNPAVVFAGGDDATGVFRSDDGGSSWTRLDALGVRSGWALAISENGRLYVGDWYGTGIFVSDDGGLSFRPSQGIAFPNSYISAIAVDDSDPDVAFATAGFADGTSDGENGDGAPLSSHGTLFRTMDGGESFQDLGSPADGALSDVAVHPSNPNIVLLSDAETVWRSIDRGSSFEPVAPVGGNLAFSAVASGVVIVAGTSIWRSDDDGEMWSETDAPAGLYADVVASPAEDAFFAFGITENGGALAQAIGSAGNEWEDVADPVYAGLHLGGAVDPASPERLLIGTFGEGVVSYDRSQSSWSRSSAGMTGAECEGFAAIGDRLVLGCGNLTFAPYVAISDDDGASWRMAEGPFEPNGLDVVMPMVKDAQDPNVLLVAGNSIRRSTDGGESWATVVDAPSFGIARDRAGVIYAAGQPFLRSIDGGESFQPYGDPGCTAWHVAADPHASGRVFASCPEEGFFVTSDGASWNRLPLDAPAFHSHSALALDPAAPDHLAATTSLAEGFALSAYVFVSNDGGASWSDVTPPMDCAFAAAILYLSDAPGHLVVGTQSADHYCPSITGRLLESFDNGTTWRDATRNLSPPQVHTGGLFEADDGALVVSTWDGGVWKRL